MEAVCAVQRHAQEGINRSARTARSRGLTRLIAPFDPPHQPLEFFRGLGAQIHVVHLAKLLGDREQGLVAQAYNVVAVFRVVGVAFVGQGHFGSAYLKTPAAVESYQRRHSTKVPLRGLPAV